MAEHSSGRGNQSFLLLQHRVGRYELLDKMGLPLLQSLSLSSVA